MQKLWKVTYSELEELTQDELAFLLEHTSPTDDIRVLDLDDLNDWKENDPEFYEEHKKLFESIEKKLKEEPGELLSVSIGSN
mgnify:FL=1